MLEKYTRFYLNTYTQTQIRYVIVKSSHGLKIKK